MIDSIVLFGGIATSETSVYGLLLNYSFETGRIK